jgi:hypothetical protein
MTPVHHETPEESWDTPTSRGVHARYQNPGRFRARRDSESMSNLTAYDAERFVYPTLGQ